MTEVRTESGVLRGLVVDDLHLFRAVPYAAPLTAGRRFAPPEPVEPWDGVRDATVAGVGVPQLPISPKDPWAPLYLPPATGDDSLTLEIWTPELGTANLPVLVHIHGGGYVTGAGSVPGHSGRAFARDGVVHVGINYRLGVEGFLYLGEGHDNLGLRDQVAALGWVQRNIAAFGGDPDRVTIIGQSGGAVSVMTHFAMPASARLFAQGIAQSGSSIASADPETAQRFTRQITRQLRVPATPEALRAVPVERTVAATQRAVNRFALGAFRGDEQVPLITPFRAVHGTELLPRSPLDTAPDQQRPLLAGTVRNETIGFVQALTGIPVAGRIAARGLERALGLDDTLRAAYRNGPRALATRAEVIEAAWSDWAFRIPTVRLLERRPAASWLYEFTWGRELGACHGIEVPFLRDDLAATALLGEPIRTMFADAPQQLADTVHGAVVRFVTEGDPGWQRYDTQQRTTMVFDEHSAPQPDPAGIERTAWDGHLDG